MEILEINCVLINFKPLNNNSLSNILLTNTLFPSYFQITIVAVLADNTY